MVYIFQSYNARRIYDVCPLFSCCNALVGSGVLEEGNLPMFGTEP